MITITYQFKKKMEVYSYNENSTIAELRQALSLKLDYDLADIKMILTDLDDQESKITLDDNKLLSHYKEYIRQGYCLHFYRSTTKEDNFSIATIVNTIGTINSLLDLEAIRSAVEIQIEKLSRKKEKVIGNMAFFSPPLTSYLDVYSIEYVAELCNLLQHIDTIPETWRSVELFLDQISPQIRRDLYASYEAIPITIGFGETRRPKYLPEMFKDMIAKQLKIDHKGAEQYFVTCTLKDRKVLWETYAINQLKLTAESMFRPVSASPIHP